MTIESTETLRMIGELKGEMGEVRGQLRELIKSSENMRTLMEMQAPINHRVPDLIADVANLQTRMAVLEAQENHRAGAVSLGSALLRSPMIGWLFGAAAIVYTVWGK